MLPLLEKIKHYQSCLTFWKGTFHCPQRIWRIFLHKSLLAVQNKIKVRNCAVMLSQIREKLNIPTDYMNNYCDWKEPKPVGRTQKHPSPLKKSSFSKASLWFDFRTNPNSNVSKSRWSSTTIYGKSFRKSSQGTSRMAWCKHNLTAYWQLVSIALSLFSVLIQAFVWLLARTWICKNSDCFLV